MILQIHIFLKLSIPFAASCPAAFTPIEKPSTAAKRFTSASAPMAALLVVYNDELVTSSAADKSITFFFVVDSVFETLNRLELVVVSIERVSQSVELRFTVEIL